MGEKERFEVLLEEMRGDIKLIAEGHGTLQSRMDLGFQEVNRKVEELRSDTERGFQKLSREMTEFHQEMDEFHQEMDEFRSEFKGYAKQTDQRFGALETKRK